jgi:hypothetical protein
MADRLRAHTVVTGAGILLLFGQPMACRGDRGGDPDDVVVRAATFLGAPGNLKAELLADRQIRVSWTNGAFYTTVFVTRTDGSSPSTPCSPPTPAGFQPGATGTCNVPSPTGDGTADTTISFDVEGCDAQTTGLCSPHSNNVSVFLRRPKTPTLRWVIEGTDGISRISFTNNEPLFAVRWVFVGFPDDSASVACSPHDLICRWTGPMRADDGFVAVACDNILCSTPSSPPVYLTALGPVGPGLCDAGNCDR